jgi:hypothetical protein
MARVQRLRLIGHDLQQQAGIHGFCQVSVESGLESGIAIVVSAVSGERQQLRPAPGTANSTTFLPLNSSSEVFGLGPSAVMTVNEALGTRSPTLIAMICILSHGYGFDYRRRN